MNMPLMNPIFVEEIDRCMENARRGSQGVNQTLFSGHVCWNAKAFIGHSNKQREIVDELVKLLLKWNPHVYVNLLNFLKFNYKKVNIIKKKDFFK